MGLRRLFPRSVRDNLSALALVFLLMGLIWLFPQGLPEDLTGVATVVDGDSLEISGTRVRLKGVDAPEGQQKCQKNGLPWACGASATRALRTKISGQEVVCEAVELDQYDRVLAYCDVGDESVNAWLVRNGWAVSFGAFYEEERQARREKSGLWAGDFQRPQDWRDANQARGH